MYYEKVGCRNTGGVFGGCAADTSTGCSSTPELEFQGEYNPESFSVCEAGEANVALNKLVLSDSAGYVSPFNSEFLVDGRINESALRQASRLTRRLIIVLLLILKKLMTLRA